MNKNLFDIKYRNNNLVSIKDLNKNVDLADTNWDGVFQFITGKTNLFFFSGIRANVKDDILSSFFNWISISDIRELKKFNNVIVEIKQSNVTINRGLLSRGWEYYEYPAILFLKDEKYKKEIESVEFNKKKCHEMCEMIDGLYIVYKSFEEDVLWIEKSKDMPMIVL